MAKVSVEERLWSKVDKSGECWTWTGYVRGKGYGSIAERTPSGKYKWVRVHRVSYELAYGSIPEGMQVCHKCDNMRCVRPDHLFLGTNTDNVWDMIRKGRSGSLEQGKVGEDTVRLIRAEYATGTIGRRRLARKYGISEYTVRDIIKGNTYAWVK